MIKQDKFKCKHIECNIDGNYCKINVGKGYNHCVIPYYQKRCEYYEEKNMTTKQIEKLEEDLKYILEDKTWTIKKLAKELINLGYQKIGKDKQVVLTKEELNEIINQTKETERNYYKRVVIPQVRKETAKKYFKIIKKIIDKKYAIETPSTRVTLSNIINLIEKEFTKQYGVDLGEEQ